MTGLESIRDKVLLKERVESIDLNLGKTLEEGAWRRGRTGGLFLF